MTRRDKIKMLIWARKYMDLNLCKEFEKFVESMPSGKYNARPVNKILAYNLRLIRLVNNVSAKDLCQELGMSESYVHYTEKGKFHPSDFYLNLFCKKFNVSLEKITTKKLDLN